MLNRFAPSSRLLSSRMIAVAALGLALAGCTRKGEIVLNEGVGISAVRSPCPTVGIPDYTGDITLFRPGGQKLASDIDVTATMTDVRTTCDDTGPKVYAQAQFNVFGRRTDTRGARQVELPYFAVVLRGGSAVVSKQVGKVTLNFADGQARAQAHAEAAAYVDRAAATLPEDVREKITRPRKAGDADAAVDPLSEPSVRAAVQRATFELLVGFQMTQEQLAYNATR
ncbi:hypothetical protein GRI58_01755 [Porphyrobacter algicida]|uniref:Uncharacterized protein n=1 Tax=Qipengyuania algicida TaxID=1836209 RepID=A0A845AFH0_9SPHN|nr:hypothetical protein [Qipengyuania algicida]MXP27545.1 hypothetical protein [Qipengyuania algicida]